MKPHSPFCLSLSYSVIIWMNKLRTDIAWREMILLHQREWWSRHSSHPIIKHERLRRCGKDQEHRRNEWWDIEHSMYYARKFRPDVPTPRIQHLALIFLLKLLDFRCDWGESALMMSLERKVGRRVDTPTGVSECYFLLAGALVEPVSFVFFCCCSFCWCLSMWAVVWVWRLPYVPTEVHWFLGGQSR